LSEMEWCRSLTAGEDVTSPSADPDCVGKIRQLAEDTGGASTLGTGCAIRKGP